MLVRPLKCDQIQIYIDSGPLSRVRPINVNVNVKGI